LENGEEFDSIAVDVVYYNRNTKDFFVEWTDSYDLYRFTSVPASAFDALVEVAEDDASIGSYVAQLKREYGPGTNLGGGLTYERVSVNSVNVTNVTNVYNETPEYSLQPPVAPVEDTRLYEAAPTQEFSLQTPAAVRKGGVSLGSGEYGFELFFTVNGGDEEKSHTLDHAKSFDDAVSELEAFASAAGIDVVIHKVVAELV
jgi:hypothetical protein